MVSDAVNIRDSKLDNVAFRLKYWLTFKISFLNTIVFHILLLSSHVLFLPLALPQSVNKTDKH